MRSTGYTFAVLWALFSHVTADCDNIEFLEPNGVDGFTTTANSTFRVSSTVDCTHDLAGSDRGCDYHRYPMGLVVHSEIRNVTVEDEDLQDNIFQLVYDNAQSTYSTNLNRTIVMNYTASHSSLPENRTSYLGFTPFLRCWDVKLTDCDDDDNLEGAALRACGYSWLPAPSGANPGPGDIYYNGAELVVTTSGVDGNNTDPYPPYDDVKDQATFTDDDDKGDGDGGSAAARLVFSPFALAGSMACAMAVTFM